MIKLIDISFDLVIQFIDPFRQCDIVQYYLQIYGPNRHNVCQVYLSLRVRGFSSFFQFSSKHYIVMNKFYFIQGCLVDHGMELGSRFSRLAAARYNHQGL